MPPLAPFRLIDGGCRPWRIGTTRIELGRHPSSAIDALAVEDDGYFVLAAPAIASAPPAHPIRLWTEVWEAEPAPPGSVVVRPGRPVALHAVVHDLAREPTWRRAWVAEALVAVLGECRERGCRRLGLEPLGMVHGRLPAVGFVELLGQALAGRTGAMPEAIWLIAEGERRAALGAALDAGGPR